jgi:hypothetical protein
MTVQLHLMTRDESITPRGVSETRRGYSKLQGITQVDTDQSYYLCPPELAKWMKSNTGFWKNPKHPSLMPRGLLLDGPPGCLAGDTLLLYRRGKKKGGRPITMQSLYRRFNGIPDGKNMPRIKGAPTYLQSLYDDGSLKYNRIISISEAGIAGCIQVRTKAGNSLTVTPDHPICLSSGEFVPAGMLKPGSTLRIKGSMRSVGAAGRKPRTVHRREICVRHHPVAGVKIVEGIRYHRTHFVRILVEAHMNNLQLSAYVKRLNEGKLEGLKFLSSDQEVHHINENQRYDMLSNLVVMSKAEHAAHHAKTENLKIQYVAEDTVTSVTNVGMVMTYDVHMSAPAHNFVANNFIVHNTCGGDLPGHQRHCCGDPGDPAPSAIDRRALKALEGGVG